MKIDIRASAKPAALCSFCLVFVLVSVRFGQCAFWSVCVLLSVRFWKSKFNGLLKPQSEKSLRCDPAISI